LIHFYKRTNNAMSFIKLLVKQTTINTLKQAVQVAVGFAGFIYFDQNWGCARSVIGPSMAPTLNKTVGRVSERFNEKVGVDEEYSDYVYFSRNTKKLERGDIVFFTRPKSISDRLIKRVVGLEGDTIQPLSVGATVRDPIVVKEGEVWVESDAGFGYLDSSVFGPIKVDDIEGIAQFAFPLFYPLSSYRFLTRDIPAEIKSRLQIPSATAGEKDASSATSAPSIAAV